MSAINASIPLQGQLPQVEGPIDMARGGLNVQQLINAVQLQKQQQANNALLNQQEQIKLQQEQQQQSDTQAFNKAFHDAGGDWDKAISSAPGLGVSGQFLIKAQQARAEQISKIATANKDLIANEQSKNDQVGKDAARLLDIKDHDERQSEYVNTRNGHILSGTFKASELPDQVPDDNHLKSLVAHSKAAQDIYKAAADARDAAAKATVAEQEAALTPQQRAQLKLGGNVSAVEMQDWLSKNPGKGPADFMAYKAKLVPQFNFNLAGGATGGLDQKAIDQQAENYFQTGKLPPVGRGAAGLAFARTIMQRASELHSGESLAEGSAAFSANKKSLEGLQKQFDSVNAFEETANKNINRLLQTAQAIPDLGARWANIPVRMITGSMIGTENMARFKADLQTAQTEATRVLNSANATGGALSDTARKELQELADGNLPFPALKGAFEELKVDMQNRHDAYQGQIEDIKKRIVSKPSAQGGGSANTNPSARPAGATHTGIGSVDKKKHWLDKDQNDLGVAE